MLVQVDFTRGEMTLPKPWCRMRRARPEKWWRRDVWYVETEFAKLGPMNIDDTCRTMAGLMAAGFWENAQPR